jgi:hypothetical protein
MPSRLVPRPPSLPPASEVASPAPRIINIDPGGRDRPRYRDGDKGERPGADASFPGPVLKWVA